MATARSLNGALDLDAVAVAKASRVIRPFLSANQFKIMARAARGEEKDWFVQKFCDLERQITDMPKTYEQDGLGDQAVAHLHYFHGASDWYITEKDMESGVAQAYGMSNLGYGPELGYISIKELTAAGAELDLHFTPTTLLEIKEGPSVEIPKKNARQGLSRPKP